METRGYKGNSDVSQVTYYKKIVKVGEVWASFFVKIVAVPGVECENDTIDIVLELV